MIQNAVSVTGINVLNRVRSTYRYFLIL